jgi:hypothetical protein
MKIAAIGGTGMIGSKTVAILRRGRIGPGEWLRSSQPSP